MNAVKMTRRQVFKLWWPVWRAFIVYALIGYAVYFLARFSSTPPEWAINLIESFKPWMGALKVAERVSNQAFPVQMLTIYTFIASMPLTIYTAYCCLFAVEIHNAFVRHNLTLNTSRLKLFVGGAFFMVMMCGYYVLYLFSDLKPGWRDAMRFSPSFSSATFSLILTLMALVGAAGFVLIKHSLFGLRLKPEPQFQD